MGVDGKIYASLEHRVFEFHHSSFLAGDSVASAGELVAEKGILKEVTRKSGHYQPEEFFANQFKERLAAEKIKVEDILFSSGF